MCVSMTLLCPWIYMYLHLVDVRSMDTYSEFCSLFSHGLSMVSLDMNVCYMWCAWSSIVRRWVVDGCTVLTNVYMYRFRYSLEGVYWIAKPNCMFSVPGIFVCWWMFLLSLTYFFEVVTELNIICGNHAYCLQHNLHGFEFAKLCFKVKKYEDAIR